MDSKLIETNFELPYYTRKDRYGIQRMTMPIGAKTQFIDPDEYKKMMESFQAVYDTWGKIAESKNYEWLNNLPVDLQKSPFPDSNFDVQPRTAAARVDVVGGKIVDINNKPAGLGLTLAANGLWDREYIWMTGNPLNPRIDSIVPDRFESVQVVTESNYPFVSDQAKFAEILNQKLDVPCRLIYADKNDFYTDGDEAVLCFSYLNSTQISDSWRQGLLSEGRNFIVNPLVAIKWDNKALMAIPFLRLQTDSTIKKSLLNLRSVFPKTYLFRIDQDLGSLEIATEISDQGLHYDPLAKETTPTPGPTYLKPLGNSGSRGVVLKTLNDWGTARDAFNKYGEKYRSGFIAQEAAIAEENDGYKIKDGFFINTLAGEVKFVAIERMGTRDKTAIIHGGSRTKLIPVELD